MPFDANLNNADSDDDDDGNEKPGPRRPAKKDVGTKKGNEAGKRPQPKRRPAEKDVGTKKGNVGKKKDVGTKKGKSQVGWQKQNGHGRHQDEGQGCSQKRHKHQCQGQVRTLTGK